MAKKNVGELRNIQKLKYWKLNDVLHEKYRYSREEADEIASFLLPMLSYLPQDRATALQMLQHKWVNNIESSL